MLLAGFLVTSSEANEENQEFGIHVQENMRWTTQQNAPRPEWCIKSFCAFKATGNHDEALQSKQEWRETQMEMTCVDTTGTSL